MIDQILARADVQVDGRHPLFHRVHQLGPHPGGPQVLDGRHELSLAKRVGPGVEALGDVLARDLVKRGGRLGSQHQRDRPNGKRIRQRDRYQLEAELLQRS